MTETDIYDAARALVQGASWPAAFPFYETVNDDLSTATVNAEVTGWTSLRFDPFESEQVALECKEASGLITIMLIVLAGSGDAAVLSAWETIRPLIEDETAWLPTGAWLDAPPVPPAAERQSPDHLWQRYDVAVTYAYEYT